MKGKDGKELLAEAKKLMFEMEDKGYDVKTAVLLIHWKTYLTKNRIRQLIRDAETLGIIKINDGIFQKTAKKTKKNKLLSEFLNSP